MSSSKQQPEQVIMVCKPQLSTHTHTDADNDSWKEHTKYVLLGMTTTSCSFSSIKRLQWKLSKFNETDESVYNCKL